MKKAEMVEGAKIHTIGNKSKVFTILRVCEKEVLVEYNYRGLPERKWLKKVSLLSNYVVVR